MVPFDIHYICGSTNQRNDKRCFMTRFLHKNIFLLLFICLFQKPVQAMDGTGVAFKVSLAGKIYHNLSFSGRRYPSQT